MLNRTSVQAPGASAVATTYGAANRPLDQAGTEDAYASDADGRLTALPHAVGSPSRHLVWDTLGRLIAVTDETGNDPIATYAYDPLDRLRLVDHGGGDRVRFRYQGLTTSAVQVIDDATGQVTRHIGTGWGGELLEDWTGSGQDLRVFARNGHHDLTWTAGSGGTVTGTVRYDPWGTATSVTGSVPDLRFQGSYADDATGLAWVITRWYAPELGRFLSEDSLLGEPRQPDSRHLYAYAEGDPVGAWDPDGRYNRRVALDFDAIRPRGDGTLRQNYIKMQNTCPTGAWVSCEKKKTATMYSVAEKYTGPSNASGFLGIIVNINSGIIEWSHGDEDLFGALVTYQFEAYVKIRHWHMGPDIRPSIVASKRIIRDTRVCAPVPTPVKVPGFPVVIVPGPDVCYSSFGGERGTRAYQLAMYVPPRGLRHGDMFQVTYTQTLMVAGGGTYVGALSDKALAKGIGGTITIQ